MTCSFVEKCRIHASIFVTMLISQSGKNLIFSSPITLTGDWFVIPPHSTHFDSHFHSDFHLQLHRNPLSVMCCFVEKCEEMEDSCLDICDDAKNTKDLQCYEFLDDYKKFEVCNNERNAAANMCEGNCSTVLQTCRTLF